MLLQKIIPILTYHSVHASEPEVLRISVLKLTSTERKIALQKLQKEGNYYHNCDVSICYVNSNTVEEKLQLSFVSFGEITIGCLASFIENLGR